MPGLTHYIIARFATVEECRLGLDGALNGSFGAAQSDMQTTALGSEAETHPLGAAITRSLEQSQHAKAVSLPRPRSTAARAAPVSPRS